jgi:tight adherence protein B
MSSRRRRRAVVLSVLALVAIGTRAEAGSAGEGLEVVLAIDTSGSMRPAMDTAKEAAADFVAAMPPEAGVGLVTFATDVSVLTPPTTERVLVNEMIDEMVAAGDTALYDAVVTASELFTPDAAHKVLVVLSDGKDEGSLATLADAVAATDGRHVEAISLTTAATDIASLEALGTVTSADDLTALTGAFVRVAELVTLQVEPVPPTTQPPAAPATVATPSTLASPPVPAPAAATVTADAATITDRSASFRLLIGAFGVFGGLSLLGVILLPRERVSKRRLGIDKPRSVSTMGQRTVSAVEGVLERRGKLGDVATTLWVADISMKPAEFVARVAAVALVFGLLGLMTSGPLLALLLFTMTCVVVWAYVRRAKTRRQATFAEQLPDVLQLVTTALRSGHGLPQALETVAQEGEEPARSEFGNVLVESRLGRDLSVAMRALADRMESKDLEWVVAAIDINRETGGNLSEILSTVSTTIRERRAMARHVRTLTAEGRLSARILTALPLLMAGWQWWANPEHFALLTSGAGLVALIFASLLMIAGGVWVHRITTSIAL